MDFKPVKYDMDRDIGENPLIWYPASILEQVNESETA